MAFSSRLFKTFCLIACGGAIWMLGAGTCVPYNFYATLLGDTIIAGTTSAVLTTILQGLGLAA